LAAGLAIPPNPAELIESHAMEEVVAFARARYDLVVIDTPPIAAVSDTFPLLRKVDGVIMVGRLGRDRLDVVERTRETLAGVGAPLLGVIANGLKEASGEYAYGYRYSSNSAPPPSGGPEPAFAPGEAEAGTLERDHASGVGG
jgi:receptor protein-tyrosine kinase